MKEFVKITYQENADAVFCGAKRFDFFEKKYDIHCGDRFTYAVFEDMHRIKHGINNKTFEVTCVDDPPQISSGLVIAGFKEVRAR